MKTTAVLFLLFAELTGNITCLALPSPEKHALIITIANYEQGSGWPRLHCNHDLRLMRETLIRQQFKKGNIISLEDGGATKQKIKAAMVQLAGRLKAGDHVVVHYSGHGQQIFDDNADELDQLDETLVAFGAPMTVSYNSYKGEKHIRDDEFGQWLDLIRLAIGPAGHLLVIFDSCNAGTAARGEIGSRGGPPIVPDDWTAGSANLQADEVSGFNDSFAGKQDENLRGPMVVLAGAGANQTNYEIIENQEIVGSLTSGVCRAFNTLRGKISYRAFFAEISATMAITSPGQTPSMEGDADQQMFGGQVIPQQAYFGITKVVADTIYLDAGTLAGASKGAKIELYPRGTALPDKVSAIAAGEVVSATPFSSKVRLTGGKKIKSGDDSWVFITERSYDHWSITIAVDKKMHGTLYKALTDSLGNEPGIALADENESPLLFKVSAVYASSIVLFRAADGVLIGEDIPRATPAKALEAAMASLRGYVVGQFLKEIQFSDNSIYNPVLSLSAVDPKITTPRIDRTEGNLPYCKVGGKVWILLENRGQEDFYYNIVDFQPNGIAQVVLPSTGLKYQPEELLLKKSSSISFPLNVSRPDGIETHRMFVSNRPFDLRTAFGSFQGKGPDAWWNTKILKKVRSKGDSAFDPRAAGVATYVFKIIK